MRTKWDKEGSGLEARQLRGQESERGGCGAWRHWEDPALLHLEINPLTSM